MRGHIEHKRDRYYVILELDPETDPENGETIRHRVGAGRYDRKRDADSALQDALERSRRGWRGPSRLSLADYLTGEWLPGVDLELAQTTAALYRTLLTAYVIPRLGGKRLDSLTAADLNALYAELLASGRRNGKPLAPKTVRHVHTTLRKALSDAVDGRHIAYNPAASAKAPKVPATKDPDVWTADQLHAFLVHIADDRLEALWIVAAASGMRRSELLGLRWRDIDLEAGMLEIRQTLVAYGKLRVLKEPKTAASRRTIPIEARTVAALKAHRKRQLQERLAAGEAFEDSGLVFTNEIGDALDPPAITAAFGRLVRDAELPKLTPHGLRHTFATVGLDAGVDVLYVAEVLGHSSPTITSAIYQHTRPERKVEAVARIGSAIFGGKA